MATRKWVGKAFASAHGQLHRALHVPAGKTIPVSKLRAAAKGSGITAKRARLALTARKFKR